jgi:pimeloyl-ACP methyl ester carboxylesterase
MLNPMQFEKGRLKLSQMMTTREGFIKSYDGTAIHFRSVGEDRPALVLCNGLGVSTFFWVYLEKNFKKSHRVVTWDYRGHGQSPLNGNPQKVTIKTLVADLKTLLDRLKIKKAILIGHSMGTQVILEFYRKYPQRALAMISCFGYYGRPMDSFFNLSFSPLILRLVYFLGTTFPRQSSLISKLLLSNPLAPWMAGILKVMNAGMISSEDMKRYVDHVTSVDPTLFSNLLKRSQETSAEDILGKVKVPTLIIAGEDDQFTPAWISKKMHRLIPKSEIFTVHRATHAGLVEQPDVINLRIEKFLRERLHS